jgi:hypothetical protein
MTSSVSWCPMDGPVGACGQLDPVGGAGQDKLIFAATVQRRLQAHCH